VLDYDEIISYTVDFNDTYYFTRSSSGVFTSNNYNIASTTAYTRLKIDAAKTSSQIRVTVNDTISSESGYDFGYVTANNSTTFPPYNQTPGRFIYVSGATTTSSASYTMAGGLIWYLHLGYRKDSSTNSYNDRFIINSVNIEPIISGSKQIQLKIDGSSVYPIVQGLYPVGSIYMSINSTNPSVYFGGTWSAWGSGRVPVGVNTSDSDFSTPQKTGGAKTVILSTSQMPSHDGHVPNASSSWGDAGESTYYFDSATAYRCSTNRPYVIRTGNEICIRSQSAGSGASHSNLQPYITCYMWLRTA
jgi:hypothetical protein